MDTSKKGWDLFKKITSQMARDIYGKTYQRIYFTAERRKACL